MNNTVVIIDDGIYECREIANNIVAALEYDSDKKLFTKQRSEINRYSHGTVCASIIQKYNPEARFISLKILDENLHSNCESLLSALEWCKNSDARMINLSLGSTNAKDFLKILESVKSLFCQKKIVIAAISNEYTYTMPACSEYSIGVCAKENKVDKRKVTLLGGITGRSQHEITVDGHSLVTPICNSYATSYVCATVIKEISKAHSDLQNLLEKYFEPKKRMLIKTENGSFSYNENSIDIPNRSYGIEAENVKLFLDCSKESVVFLEAYFKERNIMVIGICSEISEKDLLNSLTYVLANSVIIFFDEKRKDDADFCIYEGKNGRIEVIRKVLFFKIKRKKPDIYSCCDYLFKTIYGNR